MIIDAGRSSMPATFNNWASVADDGAWHAIADAAKPEKLQCFAKPHDAVEEPFYPSNPSEHNQLISKVLQKSMLKQEKLK